MTLRLVRMVPQNVFPLDWSEEIRRTIREHRGPIGPADLRRRVGWEGYRDGLGVSYTIVWEGGRQVVKEVA